MVSDKFGNVDSIMVGAVDLPLTSLPRICPDEWLDMWVIAAAMELTGKPSCVRYGLSIPLYDEEGEIHRPFGLWRKKIDKYRRETGRGLSFFCPLNLRKSHFTLLEINEQLGTIYHYDSMSAGKSSLVENAVKVSQLVKPWDFANLPRPSLRISV